jgi:hypothetical protein
MKRFLILCFLLLCFSSTANAWRKWEHINPSDLEVKITPQTREIVSGKTATFTISIRNKTDKTIKVFFPTGQRWDLAVFHNDMQIYRWSQGYYWQEAPHSVPIKSGEKMTHKLSWEAIDRLGRPLPQDIYRIQGMVMTKPRHLVTNKCSIRLLPPEIKKTEIIKAKLGEFFEIKLPRYSNRKSIIWKILYHYNDNRVALHRLEKEAKTTILTFKAKRVGHVVFDLYAYLDSQNFSKSIERRTYRIEVK